MVTADLLKSGFDVLLPVSAASPYDLVVVRSGVFYRVQVKYAKKRNGRVSVAFHKVSLGGRKRGISRRLQGFDVAAIYCPDTRTCYYVERPSAGTMALRIDEPKNGQRRRVRKVQDLLVFPEAA